MADMSKAPLYTREIRALYNSENDTIRVYQAYNDQIADVVVASNSFQGGVDAGVWSSSRMSWIKPSAVWMGYRCGWTKKDRNQTRVLALDVSRERLFEEFMKAKVEKGPKSPNDDGTVVIQWDPERKLDHEASSVMSFTSKIPTTRSIQIGFRKGIALLDPSFVLQITDVTELFAEVGKLLSEGNTEGANQCLWPDEMCQEHQLEIPAEVRAALGMTQEWVERYPVHPQEVAFDAPTAT